MNLRSLTVKKSYINKGSDNLVDALINPALENSCKYRRSVGFFSSSVFKLLIDALPQFIRNKGSIQLIVSPELSEDDIISIRNGYKKRELLQKLFVSSIIDAIDELDDSELNTLSLLVSNGILDIKVASVKNDLGIYHDKLGIFSDNHGNHIVFYGSANSSITAYQNNYEKVRTAVSWEPSDKASVEDEIREFDDLWNNQNDFLETFDFMDSVKFHVVKSVENRTHIKNNTGPISLYDYQRDAIDAWNNNSHRGFLVMATGTGKTWTAIYAAKQLYEKNPFMLVIAAPYKHLVKQWAEDVVKVFPRANIVLVSSENTHWYSIAKQAVIAQSYSKDKQVILISTIKSFQTEKFAHVLSISSQDKMLIVDEAHRFTQRPDDLKDIFKYMLGLSATPVNGKNNEAGEALMNYFGGQVYSLPIEIALQKHFLVEYRYHPIYVSATEEEEETFTQISHSIAGCFKNGILIDPDKLALCLRARLRVISMAENKTSNIDMLLSSIKQLDHFVVYCGDGKMYDDSNDEIRHIQFVKKHLDKLGIKTSQFTASEDMARRMELVDMFNNKEIDSLVAIRCLDEGINIPSIQSALILSSNDDYREFVQRRGRILRKFKDKKVADIYDVIVLPSRATPKMAQIELRRYYEYARLANNSSELLDKLGELLAEYDLTLEEVQFFNNEMEGELDE